MKLQIERIERVVTIGFAVLALIYLLLIKDYPAQAKLIPGIVAVSMLIVAALQLLGDYLPILAPITKGESNTLSEEQLKDLEPWQTPEGKKRVLLISACTIVLGLMIWLFGFVLSLPAFLFLFLWLIDRGSWKVMIGVPLVVGIFTYFLIVQLLELDPLDGLFFQLFF